MSKYFFSCNLTKDNINDDYPTLKELNYLLRNEYSVDIEIKNSFPTDKSGNQNEKLLIKGSKTLLEAFDSISSEKPDIITTFNNLEFIGFTHDNQVIFNIKDLDTTISASGIYDFTYDFFNNVFNMGKFLKYCLENDYKDLIIDDIKELLQRNSNLEKQFRFLRKGDDWFLRGFTSTRYNDYDNNVAIYLSLLSLHKFAKQNNVRFVIDRAFLSDSSIIIFYEQEDPIVLSNVGKIYFGVLVTNDEVREGKFTFEIRYRIADVNNDNIYFSAIPSELKDKIFYLSHSTGIKKLSYRLVNVLKIKEIQESMLEYIYELKNTLHLSSDALYLMISKITKSRDFSPETKSNFKELYDKNLVDNSLSIIQAFNKINDITTDINEKICLERIYHEVITHIISQDK